MTLVGTRALANDGTKEGEAHVGTNGTDEGWELSLVISALTNVVRELTLVVRALVVVVVTAADRLGTGEPQDERGGTGGAEQ